MFQCGCAWSSSHAKELSATTLLEQTRKVSRAEVLYYKNTKRSQGIAIVTMSTCHANHEDALDELNDLSLDGYNLDVRLVKKGQRRKKGRCPYCTVTFQLHI